MRVKISDLILWQWKPSICKDAGKYGRHDDWVDAGEIYSDELIIRMLISAYLNGENVPPIRINRDVKDYHLTDKGMQQFNSGKWMVQDGFHRIYARLRLGYKTIEAKVY